MLLGLLLIMLLHKILQKIHIPAALANLGSQS